jgi:hypothetical protein
MVSFPQQPSDEEILAADKLTERPVMMTEVQARSIFNLIEKTFRIFGQPPSGSLPILRSAIEKIEEAFGIIRGQNGPLEEPTP